jgi:DNA polymerase sigma
MNTDELSPVHVALIFASFSPFHSQDILISFMPYLKGSNPEAIRIHEEYQESHDQQSFVEKARLFLAQEKVPFDVTKMSMTNSTTPNLPPMEQVIASTCRNKSESDGQQRQQHSPRDLIHPQSEHQVHSVAEVYRSNYLVAVEDGLKTLLLNEDDPIVSVPLPGNQRAGSIWSSTTVASPITPPHVGVDNRPDIEDPRVNLGNDPLLTSPPSNQPTRDGAMASSRKETFSVKRVWTHFAEQPGQIWVNRVSGEDHSLVISLGPRGELAAKWSLPLDYVKQYRKEDFISSEESLDRLLTGLTVGLFRRGCTENGQQASIVSKEVVGFKHQFDPHSNTIIGTVPFFSPRTPGNVLFRMYWEPDPVHTLAIGPTLRVRINEEEFENSVRFVLSNFKGRKSNPTSLSSLHSLATVLETPLARRHDSSLARSAWGCIQEARKVVEACFQEYVKTCSKMMQLESKVEELKNKVEEERAKSHEIDGDVDLVSLSIEQGKSEAEFALIEKTRSLLGGRASCERKWRDAQLAFAGILKAVVTNSSLASLLRRDLISRMRVEYELWCPLSEEFAVPSDTSETWFDFIEELPQSVTSDHCKAFQHARLTMQRRTLGFDVNSMTLEEILFPSSSIGQSQQCMDPLAVSIFNSLSGAMGHFYQELFSDEENVVRRRELIRQQTEKIVHECGAFPAGTQVVIFGSSANGFGSPKSDLDMCLHLPSSTTLVCDEGAGAESMALLAEALKVAGMKDVDTTRLSARIPIVMYKCPDPLVAGDSKEDFLECDLSMHNPLAVLNTSLLRSYAEISPVTRVLAAIIKRWAKARDINSPAHHTLSSYGYIIMLLHFLTYHSRKGNGLVSPIAGPEGDPEIRNGRKAQVTPILPNLQWIDQNWLRMPQGTSYRQISSLPNSTMKHPMKDTFVNTHFYKPSSSDENVMLQVRFAGDDLSLAILLASFFRYYAYEFDYKRHVVSLHSTASRGIVEREVKAELDGWRNYSAALAIEDPFELDYDIAHVLRGGYYHRIRREFAMAYTKIADAATGRPNNWNKGDVRSMSGRELVDWICEPIPADREHT